MLLLTFNSSANHRRIIILSLSILPFILCALIYLPGLHGPFLFDDFPNIVNNDRLVATQGIGFESIYSAITQDSRSPLGRPVSFASFAINIALTGLNPFWFKATNLLIHLISGAVLLGLVKVFTDSFLKPRQARLAWLISLATTSAWLLHPINLSPVLYIVQRMTELSALFSFISIFIYVALRRRQIEAIRPWLPLAVILPISFLLGLFSKQNGILVPAYLVIIELLVFQFKAASPQVEKSLKMTFLLGFMIAVPFVIYTVWHYGLDHPLYSIRDFTPLERLMTEARVLWSYIGMILVPNISQMTLYHDDIALSNSLLSPPSTLLAICGLFVSITIAVIWRKRWPALSFAILFFLASHALESTIVPLEIMHEHRNYVGSWVLLWAAIYHLLVFLDSRPKRAIAVSIVLAYVLLLGSATSIRARYWRSEIELATYHAYHHPSSYRTMIAAGVAYTRYGDFVNNPEGAQHAINYFERAHTLRPEESNALISLILLANSKEDIKGNEELARKLTKNLSDQPVTEETMNALANLSQCLAEQRCQFPADLFRQMINNLLDNKTLYAFSDNAAKVYAEKAKLLYEEGNIAPALHYAHMAVETYPSQIQHWLNLAYLHYQNGSEAEAFSVLQHAKEIDTTLYGIARVARLESIIRKQ